MAGLPIDVNQLINAGKKLKADRELPVRFVVLVELDAPDELLMAVKDGFRPRTDKALVDIAAIEADSIMRVESVVDAAIVLVGSGSNHVVPTLEDMRRRAIPVAALALRDEAGALPELIGHPGRDVLAGPDPYELVHGALADWAMDRLPDKRTAIAHNFEFVRRSVAREAMKATAWQNALIGAVAIVPGADMPLMTANQGKMLLQMAAAYGEELGPERVWELGAVVGGGFVFRAFARQALTLIPGFGWALKAGVAYGGTIAMGEAAIVYFEKGATLPEMLEGLKETAAEITEKAKARRSMRAERSARKPRAPRQPRVPRTQRSARPAYTHAASTALPVPPDAEPAGDLAAPATGDGDGGL